jgi:hypothetical protein
MSLRFVVASVAALAAGPLASAQNADTVLKDLRKTLDNSALYIVFCARDAVPGHAFVVWGKDDAAKQICSVEAWGYYPEKGTNVFKIALGAVPSEMANEFLRGKGTTGTCRLVLRVSKEQYDQAEAIRRRWANKRDFKLLEEDCVGFATDVARSLGLRTPASFTDRHPQLFIRKLLKPRAV